MQALLLLSLMFIFAGCKAFAPSSLPRKQCHQNKPNLTSMGVDVMGSSRRLPSKKNQLLAGRSSFTILRSGVIIDVDDNFFTAAFFSIGLFYSLGKAYNRYLLEEVAFEQRKMEARERRLEDDPTVSEMDLRRDESEGWTSVYGSRFRPKRSGEQSDVAQEQQREGKWRNSRVAVLDREDENEVDNEYGMTDDEIEEFESKYGVEYDPYYDEPYEESELPDGKFKEDKSYGDRRYENGEVFYKDESTGLFYRQGSRPRQKKFWDLNSS